MDVGFTVISGYIYESKHSSTYTPGEDGIEYIPWWWNSDDFTEAYGFEGQVIQDVICINPGASQCTADTFAFLSIDDSTNLLENAYGIIGLGKAQVAPSTLSPTVSLPTFVESLTLEQPTVTFSGTGSLVGGGSTFTYYYGPLTDVETYALIRGDQHTIASTTNSDNSSLWTFATSSVEIGADTFSD